jgi:hypothetical protein
LLFILRDWDRIWYLAFSHEAGGCPGTPVTDVRSALSILSHLFRNPLNMAVARSWLAWEPSPGSRVIPTKAGPLLTELRRGLDRRAGVLVRGAPYGLRSGREGNREDKGGPDAAGGPRAMEVWEFVPEAGAAEMIPGKALKEASKEAEDIPVLRFSGGMEAPMALRFAHGSEKRPGLAFEHHSENGAEFGFTGEAESPHGLEHSAAVKAPA